jgi:hypothetical protein
MKGKEGGRKRFFFEKKKQKTFKCAARRELGRRPVAHLQRRRHFNV